jgi:hypothetical protein
MHLSQHGPANIANLIDGRASKSVSDALRWEIARGRVNRLGRGRYGPGQMPRCTEYRIHRRVLELRAQTDAARLSLEGGQSDQRPKPHPARDLD